MDCENYLRRVRVCHTADLAQFEPWFTGGARAGWIHRSRVPLVLRAPTPFARGPVGLTLAGPDFAARSAALAQLAARLAENGAAPLPIGELYAVHPAVAAEPDAAPARAAAPSREPGPPLLQLDRALVPWFGVAARGVHLNGYVRTPHGVALWVARRARGKRTFPGHLDNLVAGGCALGTTDDATLRKEAHEEAGLEPALAGRARPVGAIAYIQQDDASLKVDTLACYDLELPASFVPRAVDGEMESFALWPAAQVAASLRADDPWKPNCALVALDFLLRHEALAELGPAGRARLQRALRGGA